VASSVPVNLPDGPAIVAGQPAFVFDGRAYRVLPCRYCGANIAMVPHPKSGKNQPLNANGQVHFATCPNYHKPGKPKVADPQLKLF
jgi:hypothetical protein